MLPVESLVKVASCVVVLALSCGCTTSDKPMLADERLPELAGRLGLGQEIELTEDVPLALEEEHARIDMFAVNLPPPPIYGYLRAGTRLRVEHVWRSPPESATPRIETASVTFRVLPDHDPFPYPLVSGESGAGWQPLPELGAGFGNLYTLPASVTRIVPPEERTPPDQIKPLTRRQEWPRGWQR